MMLLKSTCFIATTSLPITFLHFDYSKNIKFTPKHEAQSAHFSGRQHTFYCCVLQDNENGIATNQFVYDLSPDTRLDRVMTFSIIEDILEAYPQILASGHLIICSDNCSTQYKSSFSFPLMKDLAEKHTSHSHDFIVSEVMYKGSLACHFN